MKIFLTGASRGLGLEIASQCLAAGHEVVGVSREAPKISHAGFTWTSLDLLGANLSGHLKKDKCFSTEFDVVIHNAGMGFGKLSLRSGDEYQKLMKLHFAAPLEISGFFIERALAKSRPLRIIQISSIGVHFTFPGLAAYAASKAAFEALGRAQYREWGRYGIDVLNLCPDFMETDMTAETSEETKAAIAEGIADKKSLLAADVAKFLVAQIDNYKLGSWKAKSVVLTKRLQLQKRVLQIEWIDPS